MNQVRVTGGIEGGATQVKLMKSPESSRVFRAFPWISISSVGKTAWDKEGKKDQVTRELVMQ